MASTGRALAWRSHVHPKGRDHYTGYEPLGLYRRKHFLLKDTDWGTVADRIDDLCNKYLDDVSNLNFIKLKEAL